METQHIDPNFKIKITCQNNKETYEKEQNAINQFEDFLFPYLSINTSNILNRLKDDIIDITVEFMDENGKIKYQTLPTYSELNKLAEKASIDYFVIQFYILAKNIKKNFGKAWDSFEKIHLLQPLNDFGLLDYYNPQTHELFSIHFLNGDENQIEEEKGIVRYRITDTMLLIDFDGNLGVKTYCNISATSEFLKDIPKMPMDQNLHEIISIMEQSQSMENDDIDAIIERFEKEVLIEVHDKSSNLETTRLYQISGKSGILKIEGFPANQSDRDYQLKFYWNNQRILQYECE